MKFRLLDGGNLTIARLRDDDDPFMAACRDSELGTVRRMLMSREGRATDITASNRNPLAAGDPKQVFVGLANMRSSLQLKAENPK